MPTKAQLEETIERLDSLNGQAIHELITTRMADQELKVKLARTAMEYASKYGWCDVVRKALKDMGLENYIPTTWRVEGRDLNGGRWNGWGSVDISLTNAKRRRTRTARLYWNSDVEFRIVEVDGHGCRNVLDV